MGCAVRGDVNLDVVCDRRCRGWMGFAACPAGSVLRVSEIGAERSAGMLQASHVWLLMRLMMAVVLGFCTRESLMMVSSVVYFDGYSG